MAAKVRHERIAPTLFRRTMPSGRQSWVQKIVVNGRRTDLGLGPCDLVSDIEAMEKAIANRKLIYEGGNPLINHKASVPTFEKAAASAFEILRPSWKSTVTVTQFKSILAKHAIPTLGKMPVDKIGQQDIIAIVKPVMQKTPETGTRLRRFIKDVLGWAQGEGHITENVAGDIISSALPKGSRKHKHMRSMPYNEVPAAVQALESYPSETVKLAFLFQISTAARNQEARLAKWGEIDFDKGRWNVAPENLKEGNTHVVPLSPQVVEILKRAKALGKGKGLIFPSPQNSSSPLSTQAFHKALKKLGLLDKTVPHGFRNSFGDWAVESGYDKDVADLALAHKTGSKIQQAYFRTTRFEDRKVLMQAWSNYLAEGKQEGLDS